MTGHGGSYRELRNSEVEQIITIGSAAWLERLGGQGGVASQSLAWRGVWRNLDLDSPSRGARLTVILAGAQLTARRLGFV